MQTPATHFCLSLLERSIAFGLQPFSGIRRLAAQGSASVAAEHKHKERRRRFATGTGIAASAFPAAIPDPGDFAMSKYSLPDLPYDYSALEPHISARIM